MDAFRRKVYRKLDEWKLSKKEGKTPVPVVIRACRGCGKSFVAMEFARRNFTKVIRLELREKASHRSVFKGSLNIKDILLYMDIVTGSQSPIVPGFTSIILDDIDECPNAEKILSCFEKDGRFSIIATSSSSLGWKNSISMSAMDFEEFLWAHNIRDEVTSLLDECIKKELPVPEPVHLRLNELLLSYTLTGGFPSALAAEISGESNYHIKETQLNVLSLFHGEIKKRLSKKDSKFSLSALESIPRQLSAKNKKFKWSNAQKGGTESMFREGIGFLTETGMAVKCPALFKTQSPFMENVQESTFKLYLSDVGLFSGMMDYETRAKIESGNLSVLNGAVKESLVADMLSKSGAGLFYFHRNSGMELDFLLEEKQNCTALEVKSENKNAKALRTALSGKDDYGKLNALHLGRENISRNGGILNLPLYTAFLLEKSFAID